MQNAGHGGDERLVLKDRERGKRYAFYVGTDIIDPHDPVDLVENLVEIGAGLAAPSPFDFE